MKRLSAGYVRASNVLESMDGVLEPFEAEESEVLRDLLDRSLGKYFVWTDLTMEKVGDKAFSINFEGLAPKDEVADLVSLIGLDLIMNKVTSYFFDVHGYDLNFWYNTPE
jgi:hypothetical protein